MTSLVSQEPGNNQINRFYTCNFKPPQKNTCNFKLLVNSKWHFLVQMGFKYRTLTSSIFRCSYHLNTRLFSPLFKPWPKHLDGSWPEYRADVCDSNTILEQHLDPSVLSGINYENKGSAYFYKLKLWAFKFGVWFTCVKIFGECQQVWRLSLSRLPVRQTIQLHQGAQSRKFLHVG